MNNDKKIIKVYNKLDKFDNIVIKENEFIEKCLFLENKFFVFMKDYFIYLKGFVVVFI